MSLQPATGMMHLPAQDFRWSVKSSFRETHHLGRFPKLRTRRSGLKRQCPGLLRLHPQGVSASDLSLQQACEGLASSPQLRIHILLVPLMGLERPAEAVAALWRAFGSPTTREPLALHSIVILSSNNFTLATDFLPVEPLAPWTALQLLQGKTPGRVRLRQLNRLPSRQIWKVAEVSAQQVHTPCTQKACG